MFKDFRVACALLNMIFKPPTTSKMGELITLRLLSFSNKDNVHSLLVQQDNLNIRKFDAQSISESEDDTDDEH